MALETPEHPGRVRAGGQGATQTNYFHTSRKSRRSYTDEEFERKAKAISEATFAELWKEREEAMRREQLAREDAIRREQLAREDAIRSEMMEQFRREFMQTRSPPCHDDVAVCPSATTCNSYNSCTISVHVLIFK